MSCKHKMVRSPVDPSDDRAGTRTRCSRRGCDYVSYTSCTIKRVREVTTNIKFGLVFGELDYSEALKEVRTEACGVPLFSDERAREGVCASCAKGHETDGNRFASDAERERAARSAR